MTRYVSRPVREWTAVQQQRVEQLRQQARQLAQQAKQLARQAKQKQQEAKQQQTEPPQQAEPLSSGRLRIAKSRKELSIEPTKALA